MSRLSSGRASWYRIGAEDLAPTLPAHRDHIHRKYRLTCLQYEQLIERSAGNCNGCGVAASSLINGHMHGRHQTLMIDHDHTLGLWAVRGLVCNRCNVIADSPYFADASARYNATPFYRELLDQHGVTLDGPPEPPVGSVVLDFARRGWSRTSEGWMALHKYAWHLPPLIRWSELVKLSGPHNLTFHPISS